MAGSNKRKEPTQSSRILDFFAPRSMKRTRHATSQPTTSILAAEPASEYQDIIIISDEEEKTESLPDISARSSGQAMSHTSISGMPTLVSENKPIPRHAGSAPESSLNDSFTVISYTKDTKTRYDEWGMGDEGIFPDADDYGDTEVNQVKVELCQGNYDKDTAVCPVCGKNLVGRFFSVNEVFLPHPDNVSQIFW